MQWGPSWWDGTVTPCDVMLHHPPVAEQGVRGGATLEETTGGRGQTTSRQRMPVPAGGTAAGGLEALAHGSDGMGVMAS